MEEIINGEQPSTSVSADMQMVEEDISTENKDAVKTEGSQFGKFKNADDLFTAYQNLEAEFTKKSQRLKNLEKANEVDNVEKTPIYETKDWFKIVQKFYEENPKAKGFEKEISSLILSDKQIATSDSPLQSAWQSLASKHYKTEDELVNDNEFLNRYVLNNPTIQETVLKTYLEKQKKAPALIASSKGKEINIAIKQTPKTLSDAREQVEKLFK